MEISNAAFEDLELDISDMMTDPEKFSEKVLQKAKELKEICKADHSVAGLISEVNRFADKEDITLDTFFPTIMNAIYTEADKRPLEEMPAIITMAEQLVKDLKVQFRDRAIHEAAKRSESMFDKRVAHAQYSALREKYNTYVRFMSTLLKIELDPMPPLPGNFGSGTSALPLYVFEHIDSGDSYRNHRAVVDRIISEHNVQLIRTMPLMDFIEQYSDKFAAWGWTVKQVN